MTCYWHLFESGCRVCARLSKKELSAQEHKHGELLKKEREHAE